MKKAFLALGILVIGGLALTFSGGGNFSANIFNTQKMVVFETSHGTIEIELLTKEAPGIAKNFRNLVSAGKYDNTIFHRVIPGFMIQGGDYENNDGTGGASFKGGYISDEFSPNVSHVRGMLSMANRGADTNGSQFFIVLDDASFLDGKHSIFGQVVKGMDIVDAIAKVKTGFRDAPVSEVEIEKAYMK